jgi:hypothetical protein
MRFAGRALHRVLPFVLCALVPCSPARSQDGPKKPCDAPENRQFDFWAGEWSVAKPDGTTVGENRIEIILGGCVLMENWRSTNGASVGHSFNVYADGKWHQTWVDNQGSLLELAGGLDDRGRMVLSQKTTDSEGKPALHEISWEKLDTGQVKQHWRLSHDEGRTWEDLFVGIYTRRK